MAPSRRPKGKGDELRDELLDAAEALLAERDDERAVTIRAVVERAGVTPPSLYLHFESKQALMAEVIERRFAALGDAIGEATAPWLLQDDHAGALRAGCLAYLQWAADNPGGYAVLFRAQRENESGLDDEARAEVFLGLRRRIERCRPDPGMDAHVLATTVWAALHGLATLAAVRRGFPWPPLEVMVDQLLRVVFTPPAEDA